MRSLTRLRISQWDAYDVVHLSKPSVSGKATRSVNHFIWGTSLPVVLLVDAECSRVFNRNRFIYWRLIARFLGYLFT